MGYDQMGVRPHRADPARVNQKDGFDCPGCAWPEGRPPAAPPSSARTARRRSPRRRPPRRVDAGVLRRALGRRAAPAAPTTGSASRAGSPSRWSAGRRRPLRADLLGRRVRASSPTSCARWTAPDEAVFYTSGRTSNEAAFLYQLFVRAFGTNNLPDCSNMCHESSGVGADRDDRHRQGHGARSTTSHDADLIFVVGQNPGTNHPRMLSALEKAKRNGARIVAVNPLPEAGLMRVQEPADGRAAWSAAARALADLFLQIRLGGDLALFQALNRLLLEPRTRARRGARPAPSSTQHTDGFDELRRRTCAPLDWDDVAGGHRADARADRASARRRARRARARSIVCWAMGLTQHRTRSPTIREIVNSLLLRGNIGRPGAGLCPVRGHSNVQGDRTMGIWEKPPPAFLDALERRVRLRPAARARLRHGRRDPGDARRRGRGVHRHGRQLRRRRRPTPTVTAAALRALPR